MIQKEDGTFHRQNLTDQSSINSPENLGLASLVDWIFVVAMTAAGQVSPRVIGRPQHPGNRDCSFCILEKTTCEFTQAHSHNTESLLVTVYFPYSQYHV